MKIAVLCSTGMGFFQQEVLKPILENTSMEIVGAYIDSRPRPSLKKRFLKNLKRGRGGYMIVMYLKSRRSKKTPSVSAAAFFASKGIEYVETEQPYSEDSVARIFHWSPDVLVMLGGFGIVKEPLLSMAPQGILSYHHGNMRKYRGQPVGFWELYNNETEMGVTVQRLAAGIDKGTPIVEKTIPILKEDNVSSLSARAMAQSTDMMHDALCLIQRPNYRPAVIEKYGKIYTLPNLRQYALLKLKLLFRR